MTRKYTTFVSSTYEDLKEERSLVVQSLLRSDCIPIGMELFPASNKTSLELIEQVIKECDLYVLIIAGRYGSIDVKGVSMTEREFDLAIEHKKPILAFVQKDIDELKTTHTDNDHDKKKKLLLFRHRIEGSRQVAYYSEKMELAGLVVDAINQLDKSSIPDFAGWVRLSDIYPHPSFKLPNKFIVFISGASGVGKSTVSRSLISKAPRFMALEECDLLREDVRATIEECIKKCTNLLKNNNSNTELTVKDFERAFDLDVVKGSTGILTFSEIEKQCNWLLPAMIQKCERLNWLNRPAIFEGVGISFKVMFTSEYFKTLVNSSSAVFINLHLDENNRDEHIRRLRERCEERNHPFATFENNIENIRNNNAELFKQTDNLRKYYGEPINLLNIDASGSKEDTVGLIMEKIKQVIDI
jgi:adenylate kinase family enzyme